MKSKNQEKKKTRKNVLVEEIEKQIKEGGSNWIGGRRTVNARDSGVEYAPFPWDEVFCSLRAAAAAR
jgi:hypothetical protein